MSGDHATTGAGRHRGRLVGALALTSVFLVAEAVGGWMTGSLALLADAGHMLTDVAGLALALLAIWWAARPPTPRKTYGYYRVEILAAVANAVVLFIISAFILFEAYRRLLDPPDVATGPMLVIAILGLLVNLASMWLLRGGAGESLNVRGAYLEVMGDALGSLGVLAAGFIIRVTGWRVADPIVAAGIGLFIVPRTWALLREGVNVLLEGVPPHIDVAELERTMRTVPGVAGVHDLHVWTLTSGRDAMSGHVIVGAGAATDDLAQRLHDVLHERFGIAHTTIQVERAGTVDATSLLRQGREAG